MAQLSEIEWTDSTWNPVTGCSKVSPGCKNCYAERMAKRLQAMGQRNYVKGFEVATHERTLELPLQWKSRSGYLRQFNERSLSQEGATRFH